MKVDNVTATIANNAKRRPRHPALIEGDVIVTFEELELRLSHMAGWLRAQGIEAEMIAALSMRDGIDHIVAMLAILRLGAILLPVDARWTDAEKKRVIEYFAASAFVADQPNSIYEKTIVVDDLWMDSSGIAASDFVTTWSTNANSPLLLSLSSGTTGVPKGPLLKHGPYIERLFYEMVSAERTQRDVNMLATPLYFGGGRNVTLQNLFFGATVVLLPPPYEVERLVEEVNRRSVTSLFLVPTILRRLLKLPAQDGLLIPSVKMLMCSGAMLHAEEAQSIRERVTPNLLNTYATTDGGIATVLAPEDAVERPGSVGRPAYLVDVEVVDDNHRSLPPRSVGYLRYKPPGLADGFYNNSEQSELSFRDGWFYPGDLGYLDEDGYLYIVGRSKDMIIRGGVNIYPEEVESILASHDAVRDVAVLGWPIGTMGEEVAAIVVLDSEMEETALIDFCRLELASYKVPRRLFFVEQLPRNESGKINKKGLAKCLPDDLDGSLKPFV